MELLKQLQSEGRLDSRGRFTLDLVARQHKLEVLQRKEPWLFLYKLAQAAVLAGSRQLAVQLVDGQLSVEFSPAQVVEENFLGSLLGEDRLTAPWLRQLALGVLLAFAAEGREHQLVYDDGRSCALVEPQGVRRTCASSGLPLVRLTVQNAPARWWRSWFGGSPLVRLRQSLQQRLSLCPLNVILNGFTLPALVGEQIPGHAVRTPWLFEWLYPATGGFAWGSSPNRSQRHNEVLYPKASEARVYETRWWVEHGPQRWEGRALAAELEEQQAALLACHPHEDHWQALYLPRARAFLTCRQRTDLLLAEFKPHLRCVALSAAAQLPYVPQGMARIVPVSHGLCLDEIDFPQGPPGAVVYLQRDDWEVDLGQLRTLPHREARQQALQLWEGQLKKLESFIYLTPECERMGLPMATRDGWRQYLRKRK
jgi:hypothetical protein